MAADREHVDALFQRPDRHVAKGLDGIDVEGDALLPGQGADGVDGLDHARFIIGIYDGNKDRIIAQGLGHSVGCDPAVGFDRDIGHVIALPFQGLESPQDGVVFYGRRDQVAAMGVIGPQEAEDGQVVRFRAAAGKDQVFPFDAQAVGDLAARRLDGRPGLLAEIMKARRIAVSRRQIRHHDVQDARVHRRRCRVI